MSKSVLITGANGGIGQALCRVFSTAGYFVIGSDRNPQTCVCDAFVQADVATICQDATYQAETFDKVRQYLNGDGLFGLINNAAIQILNKTENISIEDWQQTLDTNLIAPFLLIQGLLPQLKQADGSVVNISSVHATNTKPEFVCYATSKTALVGMTRALAIDLGSQVRVNAICPAAVATPMLMAGFVDREDLFQELSSMHPAGRIAQPEEVAQVALFLISAQAKFITGATLNVDGGIAGRLHDPV